MQTRTPETADYSTINLDVLKGLDRYTLPATYELSWRMGSACIFNPPGHPSYFVQNVYTQYGNDPRNKHGNAVQMVIQYGGVLYVVRRENTTAEAYDALLERLYTMPALDSARMGAWVGECWRHWAHCFYTTETDKYGSHVKVAHPMYGTDGGLILGSVPPLEEAYAVHHIRQWIPNYVPTAPLAHVFDHRYAAVSGWEMHD